MITYIFGGIFQRFCSSGKVEKNTHVKRLSKPGARIMVEKGTTSRSGVDEIYGVN